MTTGKRAEAKTVKPDGFNLDRLNYDSQTEQAHFSFSGWRGGRPLNVSGGFRVETPGDQTESQVREAGKKALKKLLRDLSDSL